jgi:hypothetical protein
MMTGAIVVFIIGMVALACLFTYLFPDSIINTYNSFITRLFGTEKDRETKAKIRQARVQEEQRQRQEKLQEEQRQARVQEEQRQARVQEEQRQAKIRQEQRQAKVQEQQRQDKLAELLSQEQNRLPAEKVAKLLGQEQSIVLSSSGSKTSFPNQRYPTLNLYLSIVSFFTYVIVSLGCIAGIIFMLGNIMIGLLIIVSCICYFIVTFAGIELVKVLLDIEESVRHLRKKG